ncbi:MAG: glycosyltransferase family 4 protein [Methylotetracoccus sp.]
MSAIRRPRKLAVFISFSGTGGVERMVLNLLPEFVEHGIEVDLAAILRAPIPQVFRMRDAGVRLIDLGTRHTTLAAPAFACYLRTSRPDVILAAKDRAIRTAVLARCLSGYRPRLVGRLGTHLSAALERRTPLARWFRTWPMRWIYRSVDCVVANAEGVAEDTRNLTRLPSERIEVIRNPVVTPELAELGAEPIDHPWFGAEQPR